MLRYLPVRRVHARQVLDSRRKPYSGSRSNSGEGVIGINGYTEGQSSLSGASTGKFEAVEFRTEKKAATSDLVSAKQWRM
ncbi:MAG: hypothetical protein ACLUTA_16250 [Blautia wexlerae]